MSSEPEANILGVAETKSRFSELIDRVLAHPDEDTLAQVRSEVEELTSAFPLYQSKAAGSKPRRSPALVETHP